MGKWINTCTRLIKVCNSSDLCDKGSLFDYIHIGNNRLDLDLALDLSKGISGGMIIDYLLALDLSVCLSCSSACLSLHVHGYNFLSASLSS